jgi:hypothetical protein
MGLISCPDCEGKVSDIAPSCPHCGRPFEGNVKEPTAATPSQDGFKNSATENVFNLIWKWILLQKKILNFILFLPVAFIATGTVLFFVYVVIINLFDIPSIDTGEVWFGFGALSISIQLPADDTGALPVTIISAVIGAGFSAWACFLKKPK